ncbi:dihydroxyacetone kinase subunit DhaL [Streptosporangium sp. DT93]|uniref:dihydroxyacetone kinase subunit DhaL n=1 Tax=Streptosporangium sp. DT93 TaxID=3393428 RepID=UPI003CF63F20
MAGDPGTNSGPEADTGPEAGVGPAMDVAFFASWIEEAARAVSTDRERLTALDAAIGDADHGSNLDRGFTAVAHALGTADPATPGALLTLVGTTLIRKVGGASGPLYGTFFREAGRALGDDAQVSLARLHAALEAGLAGVRALGSAAEGDKTMVDALAPAVRALEEAVRDDGEPSDRADRAKVAGAIGAAASAARAGAGATIPLQAHKGRASYLGPRSVGHEDPGAASTALILAALHAVATR